MASPPSAKRKNATTTSPKHCSRNDSRIDSVIRLTDRRTGIQLPSEPTTVSPLLSAMPKEAAQEYFRKQKKSNGRLSDKERIEGRASSTEMKGGTVGNCGKIARFQDTKKDAPKSNGSSNLRKEGKASSAEEKCGVVGDHDYITRSQDTKKDAPKSNGSSNKQRIEGKASSMKERDGTVTNCDMIALSQITKEDAPKSNSSSNQ